MKTPICDFVSEYNSKNPLRFHMPGHKGKSFLGIESLDITEITGADVLYNANGIIRQSEENASSLFSSRLTLYSAEGTSLSIRATLLMLKKYAEQSGKKPLILAGRNAHKTFITAAAILNIDVEWIFSQENIITSNIDGKLLEKRIKEVKPTAVYLTSPDYLGNILDIKALSRITEKYGVTLVVDNAHGAYLKFFDKSLHPIDSGADICFDSAHKTLPVLTGGAYLHIADKAPLFFSIEAENALSAFASTSPSYLILQSLDKANNYLENDIKNDLKRVSKAITELKTKLKNNGYSFIGNEPLKLTISAKEYGYLGTYLAKELEKENIFCEFCDPDFLTFMFSPFTEDSELLKLEKALLRFKKCQKITEKPPCVKPLKKALSLSEAFFGKSKKTDVKFCENKILAMPSINCPPAVSIAVCGERIDASAISCMDYYGIDYCYILDEE